jgi:hypothetical protein
MALPELRWTTVTGHYMADHADVVAGMANKPKSDGEKWMAAAKARFEAAK